MSVDTQAEVRPITAAEIESYQREGWVKLPGLVPADAAARMLDVARAQLEEDSADGAAQRVDFPMWSEWRYLARDAHTEPFQSVALGPRLGQNLSRLEGHGGGIRYWKDTVSCKFPAAEAGGSTVTGWHQDFPNHPMDRLGGGTFWIALDDVEVDQGAMTFLSGSHRSGPLGRTFTNGPRGGGRDQVGENPWLLERHPSSGPVTLRAGDATAHHPLTVHSAGVNATDRQRWAFIVFYGAADAVYTGASYPATDNIGLEVNQPFDHPAFPIVWPADA